MQKRNKKAAIELSINTIVVIVLAMSMLILGLVLVKNIFTGSIDITTMTNEQVKNQVASMFGDDKKLVVYPDTEIISIKVGDRGGFGIGLKNRLEGAAAKDAKFSYDTVVADPELRKKCGFSENEAESFLVTGQSDTNVALAPAEVLSAKIILQIPEGTTPCILRYRVETKVNGQAYANSYMSVEIKA